jgi:hypothetical protein
MSPVSVGCIADEMTTTMPGCVKHVADGSLYFVPAYSVPESPEWPVCTEAEQAQLDAVVACE